MFILTYFMASAEFFCLWGKPGVECFRAVFYGLPSVLFVIFSMSNTGPATQLALTTVEQHSEKSLLWRREIRASISSPRHSVPRPPFSYTDWKCAVLLHLSSPFFILFLSSLLPPLAFCLTKRADSQPFEIVICPRRIRALKAFSPFQPLHFFHRGETLLTKVAF